MNIDRVCCRIEQSFLVRELNAKEAKDKFFVEFLLFSSLSLFFSDKAVSSSTHIWKNKTLFLYFLSPLNFFLSFSKNSLLGSIGQNQPRPGWNSSWRRSMGTALRLPCSTIWVFAFCKMTGMPSLSLGFYVLSFHAASKT